MKRLFSRWSTLLFLALLARAAFGDETGAISATELIQRGRAELASNHWSAAESSFRLASETEPTNSIAYAWWGYTLAGLNPQRTNTWLYLGGTYYSLGRYAKAAGAYQKYVSLNPRNDEAYYRLYHSLVRLGHYGEAEKACRQAIAINPTNSFYCIALGYCLENLGHYSEADKILEKALSMDPQDPQAHYWLGISRYHEKAYPEAIASLQKSIRSEERRVGKE